MCIDQLIYYYIILYIQLYLNTNPMMLLHVIYESKQRILSEEMKINLELKLKVEYAYELGMNKIIIIVIINHLYVNYRLY